MNLFFPSHDISLGIGVKHFNPPAAALRLQEDLAWLEEIFSALPSHLAPSTSHPIPWGWCWDTREHLAKEYHISRKELPTDEQLEALRQLSNRRTTIEILKALDFKGQMPEYLSDEHQLDNFIQRAQTEGFEYIMKTPWSSSGRGLIRSSVTPAEMLRRRAMSTIQKMGGIMAERWFDKQQDFAMLFFVGQDRVYPLGYSLFDNEESGTYRQGYLFTNEAIEARLTDGNGLSTEQLRSLQQQLLTILNRLFAPFFGLPWQVGYIGIDMMTVRNNPNENPNLNLLRANSSRDTSKASLSNPNLLRAISHSPLAIHPCVELNLRCTMGVVARLWSDRNLQPDQQGRFIISPMGEDGHFVAQFSID